MLVKYTSNTCKVVPHNSFLVGFFSIKICLKENGVDKADRVCFKAHRHISPQKSKHVQQETNTQHDAACVNIKHVIV